MQQDKPPITPWRVYKETEEDRRYGSCEVRGSFIVRVSDDHYNCLVLYVLCKRVFDQDWRYDND